MSALKEVAAGPLTRSLETVEIDLEDSDRPHLVLLIAETPFLLKEAMVELAGRIDDRYRIREYVFGVNGEKSLPRYCRSLIPERPVCVFAHGLEAIIDREQRSGNGDRDANLNRASYEESLSLLNMHREDLLAPGVSVVLGVTPRVYADLRSMAGDTLSWRTSEAWIDVPTGTVPQPIARERLSSEEACELRREARQIEAILARDRRPNPAAIADLQRQLGAIYEKLGLTFMPE